MKTLQIFIILVLIGASMSTLIQFPFVSSDFGFSTGFEARRPDLSNMSLVLYDKFQQTYPNSTKDLYLEFFDEKNKTLIKNVSFFVNATKDGNVLMHELFYTHTGFMTLKFSPGSDMGKGIVNGTAEPVLGGMMSDNDVLPIEMSAFTPGTYHFHIEVLALVYANGIVDQNNPPTFDSWWSVDDRGNISKYANSTTISKIKNASPLQQFRSGIKAENVKCNSDLLLAIKLDYSPACVTESSAVKLFLRGWIFGFADYQPVYFMKHNMHAEIFVKYSPSNQGSMSSDLLDLYPRAYSKTNSNYPTDAIYANANPDMISQNTDTVVKYTIMAQNNTRGVYWLSLDNMCGLVPITVDVDESNLTISDLQSPTTAWRCPGSTMQYHVIGVSSVTVGLVPIRN